MEITIPDGKSIVAILMGIGFIGQAVGFSIPTFQRANANRDANWAARDMLNQCHEERDDLLHALLNERHSRDTGEDGPEDFGLPEDTLKLLNEAEP